MFLSIPWNIFVFINECEIKIFNFPYIDHVNLLLGLCVHHYSCINLIPEET